MFKLFQRMDTNGTITSVEFTDHIGSKKKIRLVLNHHEIAKFNDESSANELMSVLESLGFHEVVFPTLSTATVTLSVQNDPCKDCSNNPKNGGSGVCNCTIGLPKIFH